MTWRRWFWPRSFGARVALQVFLAGAIVMLLVMQQTLQSTEDQIRSQADTAESITIELMVQLSRPSLLTSDFEELQQAVSRLNANNDIIQSVVVDPFDLVVASTDPSHIGKPYSDAVDHPSDHRAKTRAIVGESGLLGTVHIDFAGDVASTRVSEARTRGLLVGSLGVAVLGLMALGVGWFATRRLADVVQGLGDVDADGVPLPVVAAGPSEVVALVAALNDRTESLRSEMAERRQSDEALRSSEQRLSLLLDAATDGMFEHRLGSEHATVIGRYPSGRAAADDVEVWTLASDIHPDDLSGLIGAIARHVEGETDAFAAEVRIRSAEGDWGSFSLRGRGVDVVDGKPTSILGAVVDVSRARELERQIGHVDKMRTLGRLVGSVTHDFNNILAVVKLNVDLLERPDRDHDLDAFRLSQISDVSEQASSLVDALLSLARPATSDQTVIELNALIRNVAEALRPLLGDRADIVLDLQAEPATIRMDRARAEQILLNLATNSHDAIADFGVITISTASHEQENPDGDLRPGMYVELRVSDTGGGIASEVMDELFEPFVTTKPVGAGTGLGLTTTRETVVEAGGQVVASNNRDGPGATVAVLLPIAAASEPAVGAASNPAIPARRDGTVLVVDDQLEVLGAVAAALDKAGYSVVEALGPEEALERSSELDRLDLLVTDLMMPGLGGAGLAEAVRKDHPGAKVLFMSGGRSRPTALQAMEGAAFIQKPFSAYDLAECATALIAEQPEARTKLPTKAM